MIPRARLAVAAFALGASCSWDYERMVDQERVEANEPNPYVVDGLLQTPPAGTVARDEVIGPTELIAGVANGSYVSSIPIPVTESLVRRGRNRFEIFCAACHGLIGDGNSEVAENMKNVPPPSLLIPRIVDFAPGRLFAVATEGYGVMPAYREELSIADRWAVVAYVQVLQLSQSIELADLPPNISQEARQWLK